MTSGETFRDFPGLPMTRETARCPICTAEALAPAIFVRFGAVSHAPHLVEPAKFFWGETLRERRSIITIGAKTRAIRLPARALNK